MLDVFQSVGRLLKLDPVCIDNNVFRLHYKVTAVILIGFSLLVTSTQFIGDPIDCIMDDMDQKVLDTYCWIHSTFTVMDLRNAKDTPHPGVGTEFEGDQTKNHKYYQWVCFVLFFQGLLFSIPRHLWKIWEGGRIMVLSTGLKGPFLEECSEEGKKRETLVKYFAANLGSQNLYAYRYLICEILNFVNVIGQIYLMDLFLGGEFSIYGLEVLSMTEQDVEERTDPMSRVFPKVTKCVFKKYGPSGTVEKLDGLCILPINIVNEKIYVFLWFWFVLLCIITALALVYRVTAFLSRPVRTYLLKSRSRLSPVNQIEILTKSFQVGDWFVLYQMGKNVNPLVYKALVSDLATKFDQKEERIV